MKRHAKASTAGSTMRQATGLGRFFRGVVATRGASPDAKGSGAPSQRQPLAVQRQPLAVFAVLASTALLVAFAGSASAAEPPEYLGSFGPDGTEATGFEKAGSVAVDQQTHDLYVLDADAGTLAKFDLLGNPVAFGGSEPYISGNEITGLEIALGGGNRQIAVDSASHTIYVTGKNRTALQAFGPDGEPHLFSAGPGAGTNEVPGFESLLGVAVDGEGRVYASDASSGIVAIYATSGEAVSQFETFEPANLAVAGDGSVYVNQRGSTVTKFTPSQYPVTPLTTYTAGSSPLDPNSSLSVAVAPATENVLIGFTGTGSHINEYDSGGGFRSSFGGDGEEGELEFPGGIAVDGASGRIYVANAPLEGLSQVRVFAPVPIVEGPPTIEVATAGGVTADSAVLHARINPNTAETSYSFEYGLGDCESSECTSGPLGGGLIEAGHDVVAVSQSIAGLLRNTTYHYRVVAENSFGPSPDSEDRTFTTQTGGLAFELPDSRVWEMVSPTNKYGGLLLNSYNGVIQAAADGNGLAYQSYGAIEADPESSRAPERSTVLARRAGDAWHSKDITPPHTEAAGLGTGTEYQLLDPDLSTAIFEQRDSTPLSPAASAQAPYRRDNSEPAAYTPLVTAKEGFANVPSEAIFGGPQSEVSISGASRDLTHVVLRAQKALFAGAENESLYMWSEGQQLAGVSILPGGEDPVKGLLGSGLGSLRNAVSDDGSRVFWSQGGYEATGVATTALYLRDLEQAETARLDTVTSGTGGGAVLPAYQGASVDGTKVFFTDSQQLTDDASPEGRDLYICEIPTGAGASDCSTLTDLSVAVGAVGESAEVLDQVSAISEDGGTVYFVAKGVLDAGQNEAGDVALAGQPNLYVWHQGEGTRFVVTLSEADAKDWGVDSTNPGYAVRLSSAGSPSGRYFSFMSALPLTGIDNHDSASGQRDLQVFRYDRLSEGLVCVSCNPTGASPAGQLLPPFVGQFKGVDPQALWSERWAAAILPEAVGLNGVVGGAATLYRPRAVFDSGRVFFHSYDPLVPADSNGNWDLYQYEPTGVGDCGVASGGAAVARSGEGCVGLVSSGSAEGESVFLDAGASGNDVFFLTSGRLSVTDTDSAVDVYNARVDGVPAALEPNAECLGESCQPAAQAPNDPTPASAGFKGAGNVRPQSDCGATSRRVAGLSRHARALRRHARSANGKRAVRMRSRARRLSDKANNLGKRAKRCRRANRRAAR